MSEMRASRKPSRSKTSLAASTRRALVSIPLRDRGPLGLSVPLVAVGRAVVTRASFRAGGLAGGWTNLLRGDGDAGGRESWPSGAVPLQEHDARGCPAARGDDRRPRIAHLALSRVVAQLLHSFVDEPEAVGPPLGELAAVGIDGKIPVQSDAPATVEP